MKLFWSLLVLAASSFHLASANLKDEIAKHKDWEDGVATIIPIADPLADPSPDEEDSERGIIDTIKSAQVKKKCECGANKVCGCCIFLVLANETASTACFNVTEIVGEKKVEISLVFNDHKLYTKNVGEKDKCASIPFTATVAKICLSMYNMRMDADGMHACLKLSLRLMSKEAVTFDFQCLLLGKNKIKVEKESGKPGTGLLHVNVPKVKNVLTGKKDAKG